MTLPAVLLTGAGGYLGSETLKALSASREHYSRVVATDIREIPAEHQLPGVEYVVQDVRDVTLERIMRDAAITTVVHLASIVTPGKHSNRAIEHSVDVQGTRNVIECALRAGVRHLIVTSSGAAYGYYADNPQPLHESDALRGNPEFAYSDHKRQIEEMLRDYRLTHPAIRQLIFRPGTILGAHTANQITNLFEKSTIIGLTTGATPFVFIWDRDVVACIIKGISEEREGIYNLAGDGTMTLREIADILGAKYLGVHPKLLSVALWALKRLGLTQYGPEQVNFLRYRPVLSNDLLKREFGYIPEKTTRQTFEYYARSKGLISE